MEVTQRNLRSQYTAAQASYEIAVDQLKKVIGMPLDQPLELADSVLTTEDQLSYKGSGFSLTNLRTYKYSEQSLLLYWHRPEAQAQRLPPYAQRVRTLRRHGPRERPGHEL
jgi:hypothetical protein